MGIHQRLLPAHEEVIQNADEENIPHLHLPFLSSPVTMRISPEILRRVSCGVNHLIRASSNRIGRFELMGESQRDFTPELAAQRLRACSDVHCLQKVDV